MKKRRSFSIVIYIVLLVLFFSWVIGLFTGDDNKLNYSDIVRLVEQNKVTALVVEGTAVKLELTEARIADLRAAVNFLSPVVEGSEPEADEE